MRRRLSLRLVVALLVVAFSQAASSQGRVDPDLHVAIFAHTTHDLDSVVWTGRQFLYVVNTLNTVWSAPPAGMPLTLFVTMKALVEETRCIPSPGTHGFPKGEIYCHSPDNKIYEISGDGSRMSVLATLSAPYPPASDGALTFDDVGRFGFELVAATGRSGAAKPAGGSVYAVGPAGRVREIGTYRGPGGADEVMIAPTNFTGLAGDALLTVDAGLSGGHLVAMAPDGQTKTLASFPGDGPNPILQIPLRVKITGTPAPGIYLTDDETKNVYYISASQLTHYAGDLFVSTEDKAHFWILAPGGHGVGATALGDNLQKHGHALEGAIYIP